MLSIQNFYSNSCSFFFFLFIFLPRKSRLLLVYLPLLKGGGKITQWADSVAVLLYFHLFILHLWHKEEKLAMFGG